MSEKSKKVLVPRAVMKVYYKVITGTGWIKAKENEINDVLAKRDDYAKRHPEYPCLKVKRVVKVTEEEVDLTDPL